MTTHIVFGDSAAGTLKQAVRGRGDRIISFADDLSWGPINSLAERQEFLDVECPIPGGWGWIHEAHRSFWEQANEPSDDRLVWLGSNNPAEVAAYLAYLKRFAAVPGAVVRPDRHILPHPTLGPLLGTGSANAEELADALDHAGRTPVSEDQALAGRWSELQLEKATLRIMDGDRLVSAPSDTYDNRLIALASADWQKSVLVVGRTLGALSDENVRVNPDFLFSRLRALVRSGRLEAQGDVCGWQEDGRRAPSLIRTRL